MHTILVRHPLWIAIRTTVQYAPDLARRSGLRGTTPGSDSAVTEKEPSVQANKIAATMTVQSPTEDRSSTALNCMN